MGLRVAVLWLLRCVHRSMRLASLQTVSCNRLLTWACRCIAVVALGTLWWFQQQVDASLGMGWKTLRANWLFKHESFEVRAFRTPLAVKLDVITHVVCGVVGCWFYFQYIHLDYEFLLPRPQPDSSKTSLL